MDGIHDLGGKHGFGEVTTQDPGPALPERWQGFVFTLINQLLRNGTAANVDHFRHAVERISPSAYLEDGYYGRWLGAGETLLVESGVIAQDEINKRVSMRGGDHPPAARPSTDPDHFPSRDASQERPPTAERTVGAAPAYAIGDRVETVAYGKSGHTRLPAYARGKEGVVVTCHNAWVYPDTHAHGLGESPEYLYTVKFDGAELFGAACEADVEVCLDLFEPYLKAFKRR